MKWVFKIGNLNLFAYKRDLKNIKLKMEITDFTWSCFKDIFLHTYIFLHIFIYNKKEQDRISKI